MEISRVKKYIGFIAVGKTAHPRQKTENSVKTVQMPLSLQIKKLVTALFQVIS